MSKNRLLFASFPAKIRKSCACTRHCMVMHFLTSLQIYLSGLRYCMVMNITWTRCYWYVIKKGLSHEPERSLALAEESEANKVRCTLWCMGGCMQVGVMVACA